MATPTPARATERPLNPDPRIPNPESQIPDRYSAVARVLTRILFLNLTVAVAKIVFGYASHCTTLQGYQLSGDYAGFAQIALERDVPGAQAMFFAGCGGDQNPLPRGTVEQAERYGEQLAASVRQVLPGPMRPIEGGLRADYREIDLTLAPA